MSSAAGGQTTTDQEPRATAAKQSNLLSPSQGPLELAGTETSPLAAAVERYSNDRRALYRRYDTQGSGERRERLRSFLGQWQSALKRMDFSALPTEGRVDWLLLSNRVRLELKELDREAQRWREAAPLLPFSETVLGFQESRRRRESIDPQVAAAALLQMTKSIEAVTKSLERGLKESEKKASEKKAEKHADTGSARSSAKSTAKSKGLRRKPKGQEPPDPKEVKEVEEDEGPALAPSKTLAHRAARYSESLGKTLKGWYLHHEGYDPLFGWWVKDPYAKASKELEEYVKFLREKIVGVKKGEDAPIVGDPVGRAALLDQLESELIAYEPEQLIAIAERELAWCEDEMRRAANEMGFGDDWKAALEKVKSLHVPPGDQPALVRDLAYEAEEFVEQRGLVTVPPLAKEIWRIEMMSPERQKMNPFFLGGEVIRVSFPTDGMTHEQKLMSLRGNNRHFSRATVHHELIPGHHLQGFMTSRYNNHRQAFSTPFWGEGWALYWELLLWDLGFPQSPEDRIGMLFWRMHRCARVIWSLGFHLGQMTPQESVDFLVERIGHERENALGEVRRSFEGRYSPLYQLAYLMGGMQFRALRRELVEQGEMLDREFHDRILRGGRMPVEMVRARLTGQQLVPDYKPQWLFQGEIEVASRAAQ